MKKNILLSTYGTTWHLLPELLGFTNAEDCNFYNKHPDKKILDQLRDQNEIEAVSEVWLITTANSSALETVNRCRNWLNKSMPHIGFHALWVNNLYDLRSVNDCRKMKNLIYRAVLNAQAEAHGGKVILSMVGGYKTMSSDLQNAGHIWGCHALIHVLMNDSARITISEEELQSTVPEEKVKNIVPIVVSGKQSPAAYLYKSEIIAEHFPVLFDEATDIDFDLEEKIIELQNKAEVVLSNFSQENENMSRGNFRSLSSLHPQIVERLKTERIGADELKEEEELLWLSRLPKAELHCHFGGILNPDEMVAVAGAETNRISEFCRNYPEYQTWIDAIANLVKDKDVDQLRQIALNKKSLRKPFIFLPEPLGVCGFLLQFSDNIALLKQVIYNELCQTETFCGIGIDKYEKLGDLQGSALLQSEACIRAACDILLEQCKQSNTKYLELRCSPINYTRGGLSGIEVVSIILDQIKNTSDTYITLLFIASRHGRMSDIYRHIELAEELLNISAESLCETEKLFKERFVGFDLAGAENVRSPKELREAFESLHKRCLNLTIHAGETASAESIWEAVYHLSADRIGHGLKLQEQPELLNRFLNRHIAIEMCPTSNYQICGFSETHAARESRYPLYPLKYYMDKGLIVTLNTDDPGISLTNLTAEYMKAAKMTPGGISKWDILQLINNSFSSTFAPFVKRREYLKNAENAIMKLIEAEYGA